MPNLPDWTRRYPTSVNLGPWATAAGAGSKAHLSTFWKRRLAMLPTAHRSSIRLGGRVILLLLITAGLVWVLPTCAAQTAQTQRTGPLLSRNSGPKNRLYGNLREMPSSASFGENWTRSKRLGLQDSTFRQSMCSRPSRVTVTTTSRPSRTPCAGRHHGIDSNRRKNPAQTDHRGIVSGLPLLDNPCALRAELLPPDKGHPVDALACQRGARFQSTFVSTCGWAGAIMGDSFGTQGNAGTLPVSAVCRTAE